MEQINKEIILIYLKENKDFFEKEFGVTKIALFGSYARDEAREDSDIDLLIEAKEYCFTNRFNLTEHLELHFNKKVDLGYFSSVKRFIRVRIEKDIIYA